MKRAGFAHVERSQLHVRVGFDLTMRLLQVPKYALRWREMLSSEREGLDEVDDRNFAVLMNSVLPSESRKVILEKDLSLAPGRPVLRSVEKIRK